MRLSIILTVYNKESCLTRVIDSLLLQEYFEENDYEIVIVNDGSTDGSYSIIENYRIANKRIRVVNQDNRGLSVARNNGTKSAHGDYVWYVDADDIISTHSIRSICDAMRSKPDIIPIYAKTDGICGVRNCIPESIVTGKDILISKKWEQCSVFYVFRKDFLKENGLSFIPGIYHEDAEFTPRMLFAAKTAVVVPKVLYIVIHEPNSITSTPHPKRAFDCLTVAESLACFIEKNQLSGTDIGSVIIEQVALMINNGLNIIVQNAKDDQNRFDNELRSKPFLIYFLKISNKWKYRLEGIMFSIFHRHYIKTYKVLLALRRFITQ